MSSFINHALQDAGDRGDVPNVQRKSFEGKHPKNHRPQQVHPPREWQFQGWGELVEDINHMFSLLMTGCGSCMKYCCIWFIESHTHTIGRTVGGWNIVVYGCLSHTPTQLEEQWEVKEKLFFICSLVRLLAGLGPESRMCCVMVLH